MMIISIHIMIFYRNYVINKISLRNNNHFDYYLSEKGLMNGEQVHLKI